jgi:hypothetical protein
MSRRVNGAAAYCFTGAEKRLSRPRDEMNIWPINGGSASTGWKQAPKALQCIDSKIYAPASSSKNWRLAQGALRK